MLLYNCECLLCHNDYVVQKHNIQQGKSNGCAKCYLKKRYGIEVLPKDFVRVDFKNLSTREAIAKVLCDNYPKEMNAEEITKAIYNAPADELKKCQRNVYTMLCVYLNKGLWVRVKQGKYQGVK